ncbi:hypothetical protein KP509_32G001300 [Ceratopteris richardii]|uniref:Uncharacterized protein n=1 Tax=Ceratopteris richardii TaxID=49495 RepID=A0A8T2QQT9_CERRI|nr:hypothetical protein KP509_32G001300 [Ceratopteris richardii]
MDKMLALRSIYARPSALNPSQLVRTKDLNCGKDMAMSFRHSSDSVMRFRHSSSRKGCDEERVLIHGSMNASQSCYTRSTVVNRSLPFNVSWCSSVIQWCVSALWVLALLFSEWDRRHEEMRW